MIDATSADRMRPTARVPVRVALAAAAIALVLIAGSASGFATTLAAWSDPVRFAATASTGTWLPPASTLGSCTVVDSAGAPVTGASCSIASVRLVEQGGTTAGNLLREYELTTTSVGGDADDVIAFQVDLASPDVDTSLVTPNPDWSWTAASTSPTAGYTIEPDYPCSALPTLRGTLAPAANGPALLKVNDHLTADRTCVA